MRRLALWCLSTLAVLVLLFSYPTSTSSTMATSSVSPYRSGREPGVVTPSPSSGSSSGSSSGPVRSRVTGDSVDTEWGPVQVVITVSGGRITDVSVPVFPSGNPRDAEINSFALPRLVQETLDQQSAQIDMVSGATVTSGGYLRSLQSALDQAGL